jgi:hypothetical protein
VLAAVEESEVGEICPYQYSASLKFWYVRPWSLRYSRIVELMDAVELALLSLEYPSTDCHWQNERTA